MNERYSRQILFPGIGTAGQDRLRDSRVALLGMGALGSSHAEALARAGIGRLKLVDRDFVEASNLQRQTLYSESDAEQRLPKSVAAAKRLREINSEVETEVVVTDVNSTNIEDIVKDFSPCLACVFEEMPEAGSGPTCDTAGVIQPIIQTISALQVTEALKILTGREDKLHGCLIQTDIWENRWNKISLAAPTPDCRCCVRRDFSFLIAESAESVATLCGRDAVQVRPMRSDGFDLGSFATRLKGIGDVRSNEYLVRFTADGFEVSVFSDGRAIIKGTDDASVAKGIYARYVGT